MTDAVKEIGLQWLRIRICGMDLLPGSCAIWYPMEMELLRTIVAAVRRTLLEPPFYVYSGHYSCKRCRIISRC